MAIDMHALAQQIGSVLVDRLKKDAPGIAEFARAEGAKIAQSIATIEGLALAKKITHEECKLHLRIQRNASRTILLTAKGLGLLTVENAINAALDVVKSTVNTAIGFSLIPI